MQILIIFGCGYFGYSKISASYFRMRIFSNIRKKSTDADTDVNSLISADIGCGCEFKFSDGYNHIRIRLHPLTGLDGKHKTTQKQLSRKSKITPIAVEENAGTMVLPFTPLAIAFQDVKYFVDTPKEGYTKTKLQLLSDITGAFRPGILSALMGVSGAGKTTLMDVLSGRKTGGYVEGEIKIGGYPKVQETFARISGYCEQTDIHSPNVTVKESVIYSAWGWSCSSLHCSPRQFLLMSFSVTSTSSKLFSYRMDLSLFVSV